MSRAAAAEPPTIPHSSSTKDVPVRRERLTKDAEVHSRTGLDEATVARYAELITAGEEFPPLVVFNDGMKLWLADGWQRDAAYARAGIEAVPCDIRQGTRRDAILHSIRANARHGLPFTNAEKRQAVARLLKDEEWGQWSDREIARQACVSKSFVGAVRLSLRPETIGAARLARRGPQVYKQCATPLSRPRARRAPTAAEPTSTSLKVVPAPAAPKPEAASGTPDYTANWLQYLRLMTPEQLVRWRAIIKSRVSLTILAEAVDVVMRESSTR